MTDLIGPLPNITLQGGMTVFIYAYDMASASFVPGVVVSQISIYGDSVGPDSALPGVPAPQFLPFLPYGENT